MYVAAARADTRAMNRRLADSARSVAASLRRRRHAVAEAAPPAPSRGASGLATCTVCARDFVTPVSWEPVGEHGWWMLLRCAECGTWREVTVPNTVAERYDDELAAAARTISRTARRLEMERMAAEAEAFAAALRDGLIEPADFAA
jgi:hypothetical protein